MISNTAGDRIIRSKFRPPWWLVSRQAQTIYPQLPWAFPKRPQLRRESLELPDGDVTAIDWPVAGDDLPLSAPLLVILHGLEGSAESSYARMLMRAAIMRRWRSCVLHSRDCGDYRNRLPRRYHAGETNDIRFFLGQLRERGHSGPLFAAGYSLGGNILLKYLGESAQASLLAAAVAVCAPLDLHQCAGALNTGFSKFYQHYLIKRMKTSLRRKFNPHTAAFDWQRAMQSKTFAEFDDAVTAPLHGFQSMQDYYDRCSSGRFLIDIRRPTLIINALDDPFMTPTVIPAADRLSDQVTIELAQSARHDGFIEGGTPWRPRFYLPPRILGFLEPYAASTSFMDSRTRP
ncbi:MAG: hydrolase [Gammaproteobacteria bacterium]|nr:hydrolase [Gammaproteobacteria bacterium]